MYDNCDFIVSVDTNNLGWFIFSLIVSFFIPIKAAYSWTKSIGV